MVNTYKDIRDINDFLIEGRTKLFIENVDSDGNITEFSSGIVVSPSVPGTLFIVDSYVVEQIEKIRFIDNKLVLKDGESLELPKKTPEQIEKEELLKRLAELEKIEEAPIVE